MQPRGPVTVRLWPRVDELVDCSPRLADLRHHGLQLLAARRLARRGQAVPAPLVDEQRAAGFLALIAAHLLERARDACSQPLVLMKGPELAARYPDPALRPFRDLDLLVADAGHAQAELMAAGFEPVGVATRYEGIHHLQPLRWPGMPLVLEVHDSPKWIDGLPAAPTSELLEAAVPSATGVDGILALPPEHHALVVTAHSWAHVPLSRLLHLVDVAALLDEVDAGHAAELARRWGLERVWETTLAVTESMLAARGDPWAVRLWARNVRAVRERTVLESHLERWLAVYWALPPRQATGQMAYRLGRELRPRRGESRSTQLRRTAHALQNAFVRQSDHHRSLDRLGIPFGPTTGDEA